MHRGSYRTVTTAANNGSGSGGGQQQSVGRRRRRDRSPPRNTHTHGNPEKYVHASFFSHNVKTRAVKALERLLVENDF